MSSVHPPDAELLAQFCDPVGRATRTTEAQVELPAISIDDAVDQGLFPPPAFVKLDVHGSEYEALDGARKALATSVVGVLVETWYTPVHRGQRLNGHVEALLNDSGFHAFHIELQPEHYGPGRTERPQTDERIDRRRLIAAESLFFRDFSRARAVPRTTALFSIACADLFAYNEYAILLSRSFASEGVLDARTQGEVEAELRQVRKKRTEVLAEKYLSTARCEAERGHLHEALRQVELSCRTLPLEGTRRALQELRRQTREHL